MAILTWRNVDAPNGAGNSAAMLQGGNQISQSLFDLAAGLGQFGQAQTDRADAAALQAANQITDSGAYAQAMADGSLLRNAGIDPNQVSARVSQMLGNRQGDLLQQDFQRAQIANQQADNDMALRRFALDERKQNFDMNRAGYNFDRAVVMDQRQDAAYADTQAAQAMAYQLSGMGLDAAGARDFINSANVSDKVKVMVGNALGLKQGGILPTVPGSGTPGGSRGADAVYGYDQYLTPGAPLSRGTFGNAHSIGQQLIPLTRGQVGAGPDKGTSAVGAYQFTGDTMERYAQKVFGDKWRDTPFTFENQTKIAKALFEDSKGGNLKAVWAGLDNATPGAYKDYTFEQFQREVLPKESGMTLEQIQKQEADYAQADLISRIGQANTMAENLDKGMAGNAAQRIGNIDLDQYFKDSEDKDPDLTKAAANASKQYPSLKGTELNLVSRWLNQIQQQAAADGTPLTAKQATHILGASMSPSSFGSFHPFNGAESGLHFDEDKMQQVLSDVNQGGNLGRSIVSKQIAADREVSNKATTVLNQALEAANDLRNREAQGLPVAPAVRKQVNDALEKALAKREQLNNKFNDPAYQQKLAESDAEVAATKAAEARKREAAGQTPTVGGYASGSRTGIAPSNRVNELLEQRISR